MKNGPDDVNNVPVAADDRFAGQLGYRGGGSRRDSGDPAADLTPRNGSTLDGSVPAMSLRDLDALAEPVYPPTGWLDPAGSPLDPRDATLTGSPLAGSPLADHPLLRGLLLELPPKGAVPPPEWLDRWFEAARSILELLYMQHNAHGGGRR